MGYLAATYAVDIRDIRFPIDEVIPESDEHRTELKLKGYVREEKSVFTETRVDKTVEVWRKYK